MSEQLLDVIEQNGPDLWSQQVILRRSANGPAKWSGALDVTCRASETDIFGEVRLFGFTMVDNSEVSLSKLESADSWSGIASNEQLEWIRIEILRTTPSVRIKT